LAHTLAGQTDHYLVFETRPGEWPSDPGLLPYFLTEGQLAHLLGRSIRTLQRRRRLGTSPPFVKNGKEVMYPRDRALAFFGAGA
jgi:hypothetical protein